MSGATASLPGRGAIGGGYGLRLRASGFGLRASGLGLGARGSGLGARGLGLGPSGFGCYLRPVILGAEGGRPLNGEDLASVSTWIEAQQCGYRQDSGFRVQGSWFRVLGLGYGVTQAHRVEPADTARSSTAAGGFHLCPFSKSLLPTAFGTSRYPQHKPSMRFSTW